MLVKEAQDNNKQSDKQVHDRHLDIWYVFIFNINALLAFVMVIIIWFAEYTGILIRIWMRLLERFGTSFRELMSLFGKYHIYIYI